MTTATDIAPSSAGRFWTGVAAYLLPSFPIAFVWHLVLFKPNYDALRIYRDEPIVPFGLMAMMILALILSWAFPRLFPGNGPFLRDGLLFGLGAGVLSWTFTTLVVAAHHPMTSIPTYMALETGFTILQFAIAGPLIALAWRR